jgi:hypothetical protein
MNHSLALKKDTLRRTMSMRANRTSRIKSEKSACAGGDSACSASLAGTRFVLLAPVSEPEPEFRSQNSEWERGTDARYNWEMNLASVDPCGESTSHGRPGCGRFSDR